MVSALRLDPFTVFSSHLNNLVLMAIVPLTIVSISSRLYKMGCLFLTCSCMWNRFLVLGLRTEIYDTLMRNRQKPSSITMQILTSIYLLIKVYASKNLVSELMNGV